MSTRLEAGLPQFTLRPKMLVVDDLALNIRMLHELFQDNFDVYMATDGLQAITKAQELLPDLILLDVVMPGMDGFEVCRRLKEDTKTAHIPIIFITGNFDEEDEVQGFQLGGSDFIHKPINPTITRARVNNQLALKQQADQLRDIALIDGLTGIANRRRFDQELATLWRQCQRKKVPLSLVMLDVDYFKQFNDHYGHQLGDSCLQWIARAVKQTLSRPQDIAARYGGEEFVCILPDTHLEGATYVARQILGEVISLRLEHASSAISDVVTVSLGVATVIPDMQSNPEKLVEAADAQLYAAKQAGRAQVLAVELSTDPA